MSIPGGAVRALALVVMGYVLVFWGLKLLDIEMTRKVVGALFLLPIGGTLIVSSLWKMVTEATEDD